MPRSKTPKTSDSPKLTPTEEKALSASPFRAIYSPAEKIPTIVVEHFPALGKLVAMRFVEWVQENPDGVISLPTGKSPEHFIKWVTRLLEEWDQPEIQKELEEAGVDPTRKPEMGGLHFVQIDEFYPISPKQQNSFHHYVTHFYIEGLGLDPEKALLMDCSEIGLDPGVTLDDVWGPENRVDLSLRYRHPRNHREALQRTVLKRVDQWCMEYEDRIDELGGIGFFLGGIGPDGHIGFNISGSSYHSTTRLCPVNYETQAAAATDLGGIEVARECLVITIGLGTIARNPDCVALVMAAGEAKAGVVARGIQSDYDILVPAGALHSLPNARFYLTRGAASRLIEHRVHQIETTENLTEEMAEEIVIDLSDATGKRLVDLTKKDYQADRRASALLSARPDLNSKDAIDSLNGRVRDGIVEKIQAGMGNLENTRFLHTEPHHDDVMLGYFARVVRLFRHASNTHHFVTLTSGFTSVTNLFMKTQLEGLLTHLGTAGFHELDEANYFDPDNAEGRNRDVWQYLDGVAGRSDDLKAEGCARRMLRNLIDVFDEDRIGNLRDRIQEMIHYFTTQYPGKRDPEYIQRLKGMAREWEAECLWGYYGWNCDSVMHLRLGFYTGSIFTEDPTVMRDVPPIVKTLAASDPDVVTVALDPEASGPDTHYKVLQAIAEALRVHRQKAPEEKPLRVWGYRNVWYRFHPSEANVFAPVSLAGFSVMHDAFRNAFMSQKDASFPSHEHDGPFSELAQRIQVEQYHTIKTCLGREWFYEHESPLIRATRGFVFLKEMDLEAFYDSCRQIRQSVENY